MLTRTFSLIAGLGTATLACQMPEFMQQYHQRLGGAVQELSIVVEDFDRDAQAQGLSRSEALDSYSISSQPFINTRGLSMTRTLDRFEHINAHYEALSDANILTRPVLLAQHSDKQLMNGAWQDYKPAIPTTPEGIVYGLVGFLFGGGLVALLGKAYRRLRHGKPEISST